MERAAALACGAVVLLLAGASAEANASPAQEIVAKINDLRRGHGLGQLQVSRSLTRSAHAYSETMMDRQYFGHVNRIQASSRYRRLGEILEIHRGRKPDVNWAFSDWLRSPTHLAVMLDAPFTYVGVGYTSGRFHGRAVTIWTVHFGKL